MFATLNIFQLSFIYINTYFPFTILASTYSS